MTVLPTRRWLPAWLPPAALLLTIVVALGSVILLARRSARPDVPPEPPAFQPPAPVRPFTALDVQQVSGGRLTLSDGSRDVALRPDARIEVLRPVALDVVRAGDWLGVIGVANEVRNFSIRSLLLIPNGGSPDSEGVVRTPGGFAGHEAARDPAERPILGGVVTAFDGRTATLQGPTGPIMVDFTANAPLRRLTDARAEEIREGDRLAFPGGGSLANAPAVLVAPGGAR